MSEKQSQAQMTSGDFQRLLQITLSDLSIRRTLLENQLRELQDGPRSLEVENQMDQADAQIQQMAQLYRHYQQFVDPKLAKKLQADEESPFF